MKMLRPGSSLLLFPCLALGIHLGSRSLFSYNSLLIPFTGLLVIWLYFAYRGRSLPRWLFVCILLLGGLLLGQLSTLPQQAWVNPREGEFTGRIYNVQTLSYDQRVLVRLVPSRLQVAVHLPLNVELAVGDTLTFAGTIAQPPQAPNPGVFCYRSYLLRLGVYGVCYPHAYEIEQSSRPDLLNALRTKLRENITDQVRDPGLVLALVLGQKDQLGSDRQESWRRLGISHLLAISGMHVGFAAMGLGLLVNRLPVRPLARLLLLQGGLLVYILIAGSGASAWRALVVSLLGGYAAYLGQRQDPLHLWATAGWLLLLARPSLAFDTGFCLSFAASGGILLWGSSVRLKPRQGRGVVNYIMNSLLLSAAAQLSLAPLLFGYFGEVALLGPVATLIFLPFVLVLMLGGFLTALGLGPFGVGAALNGAMKAVGALERMLLPYAAQLSLGSWTLLEVYLLWAAFIYAGWRLRQPRLIKPKRTLHQLITAAVVLLFIFCLPPAVRRPLEVTAINVGQGDSFLIRTPGGKHVLVDGGGDSPYWQARGRNVGEDHLLPYLRHRNISRLDYVILSHPHEDHLFGLLAVLEHLDVGMVIDNGHEHTSPTYERYLELIYEKGIDYHTARAGDKLSLGDGVTLSVLYPERLRRNLPAAYNNNSLLLRLQYGGLRMLFTGDLENAVLYDLAADPGCDLQADWLKVPHHGSRGSLLEQFYRAVDPSWAVISAGPNRFGHPHQEVIDFLEQSKIEWRLTADGPQTFHIWWGIWGRFISPRS